MTLAPARIVILSAILAGATSAQTQCPDPCPNQGRTKVADPGTSNVVEVNCAQFTISILGQTLSTPAKCPSSYVVRDATEFGCGGSLPGYCCKPKDHRVTLKIYGPTNTCPTIPNPLPNNLQAAAQALQCGTPKLLRQTFNWSAGVLACKGGSSNDSSGELSSPDPNGYTFLKGHPDDLLGEANTAALQPWFAPLETVDPVALPSPLREVWIMCPPVAAVQLVARVTIAYPQSGEEYSYDVSGFVSGDGRFSIREASTYEGVEGDTESIALDISFDHRGLFYGQQGRPAYCAYAATRDDIHQLMGTIAASAMPLVDWAHGSCAVSRLEGVQRTTEVATAVVGGAAIDVVRVTESIPGSGWNGSRIYDCVESGGLFQPVTVTNTAASGDTISIKRLSDYQQFEPGGMHLLHLYVVVEDYEPGATQPTRVVTLQVSESTPVGAQDTPTWRRGSTMNWWYVFQ